jgi:hypothetical protein
MPKAVRGATIAFKGILKLPLNPVTRRFPIASPTRLEEGDRVVRTGNLVSFQCF